MADEKCEKGFRERYGRYLEFPKECIYRYVEGVSKIEKIEKKKVRCPYCGYPVNAIQTQDASCKGIFFKCKNKECKKEFELRI